MPEGPSIVILREELARFKGKIVLEASGNASIDHSSLLNKKILDFKSWGKHFLIIFRHGFLRIHLLMFGKYLIDERKDQQPRVLLRFKKGEFSFYSCSVKFLDLSELENYDWRRDTMSDEWDHELALRSVRTLKSEMICDVLLDQQIFAGVGNIIKNEVLFLCKVHPETHVQDIPLKKLREIVKAARDYCFDFYKWKKLFVLRKNFRIYKKIKCSNCANLLERRHTGKSQRWSCICTSCQHLYM
jgi:endonuclease-8